LAAFRDFPPESKEDECLVFNLTRARHYTSTVAMEMDSSSPRDSPGQAPLSVVNGKPATLRPAMPGMCCGQSLLRFGHRCFFYVFFG
jgi:hypothetical protein